MSKNVVTLKLGRQSRQPITCVSSVAGGGIVQFKEMDQGDRLLD